MTAVKIAISLPPAQLARARLAVRRGRAESLSAYIAGALVAQDRESTLAELVANLVARHGEPSAKDKAWARNVLKRRRG